MHRTPDGGPVRTGVGPLLESLRVKGVPGTRTRGVNIRMTRTPAPHRSPSLLWVALHPSATVRASPFRIGVWHRTLRTLDLSIEGATSVQ
jgi:hypothetical protein